MISPSPRFESERKELAQHNVPIEVELGHRRMVYADFFKFLADYSELHIPAGVMIVAENADDFAGVHHEQIICDGGQFLRPNLDYWDFTLTSVNL